MASPELKWAVDKIAADRGRAGVCADFYDPAAARASLPPTDLPLPEGMRAEYAVIEGVTCYWVTAPGADPDRRIVYFHGGGYCAGNFGSHRTLAGWLAKAAGAAVLFAEYRLAPEHRFPAGADDCFVAYRHALRHGPAGRSAPAQALFVGGDSAGAALAVSTQLDARSAGLRLADGAILLCGMLDLDEGTSKFLQMLQRTRDMVRVYVKNLADLADPRANSLLADLRGLPPMLLQTGTDDYCQDDSVRFAARCKEHGVTATLEIWPEMIHVWQRFAPKLPEAVQSLERIAAWCAEVAPARAAAAQ